MTKESYHARQADALSFKQILQTPHVIAVQNKLREDNETRFNEMVIALRKHNAGLPIYAERPKVPQGETEVLYCFSIDGQDMRSNNITISELGAMQPTEKGTSPPRRW